MGHPENHCFHLVSDTQCFAPMLPHIPQLVPLRLGHGEAADSLPTEIAPDPNADGRYNQLASRKQKVFSTLQYRYNFVATYRNGDQRGKH